MVSQLWIWVFRSWRAVASAARAKSRSFCALTRSASSRGRSMLFVRLASSRAWRAVSRSKNALDVSARLDTSVARAVLSESSADIVVFLLGQLGQQVLAVDRDAGRRLEGIRSDLPRDGRRDGVRIGRIRVVGR